MPNHADASQSSLQVGLGERAPWFRVSCCPTNVSRTFATLDAYVAVADDEGVSVSLYAPGRVRTQLDDGRTAEFEIESDYPQECQLWRSRDPHWSPVGGESLTARMIVGAALVLAAVALNALAGSGAARRVPVPEGPVATPAD